MLCGTTKTESVFVQSKTTSLQMEFGTNANWWKRLRSKKRHYALDLFSLLPLSIISLNTVLLPLIHCFKGMQIFQFCLFYLFFRKVIALLIFLKLTSSFFFIMAVLSLFSSCHFTLFVYFSILLHVKYIFIIANPSQVISFSSCKVFSL